MTIMTDALKKAGVSVPNIKRVWTWLNDHPEKTAKDVMKALSLAENTTYAVLSDLLGRGMITAKKEQLSYSKGVPGPKFINIYRAVGSVYELRPKMKNKLVEKPAEVKIVAPLRKVSIDELSVVEAKALYEQLKEIFG